jgi:hypothetical protein
MTAVHIMMVVDFTEGVLGRVVEEAVEKAVGEGRRRHSERLGKRQLERGDN